MRVLTQTITFGASPVQITPADTEPVPASTTDLFPKCTRIYVEPLAANTATCYVGVDNSIPTSGVISELPKPALTATSRPTFWELVDHGGLNSIDLSQFWFSGTSGDGVKVSFFIV